ncbi:MAG: hypothetical protein AAF637_22660 [Pseudomonadota bacterium]
MADSCYGHSDPAGPTADPGDDSAHQAPDRQAPAHQAPDHQAPDQAAAAVPNRGDVSPEATGEDHGPVAERPTAGASSDPQAMGPGAVEFGSGVAAVPLSAASAEPKEPRLALGNMTPAIDNGVLMILGPEGDPVPPLAFSEAAALRPEL